MIERLRRLLLGHRRPPTVPAPATAIAAEAAEAAALAVELRLLSHRLSRTASDLARIHGVERRRAENG